MNFNSRFFCRLFTFSIILSVLAGCEDKVVFVNSPPGNLTIARSKCYIWTTGELGLVGGAEDADGDPLSYSWTADLGEFIPPDGKGQSVKWIAPEEPGFTVIRMKVTDNIDERTLSITVDIGERFPTIISGNKEIADRGYTYVVVIEDSQDQTISISESTILTIGPGVKIIVDSEFGGFTVKGTLVVEGTEDHKVSIRPNSCGFGEGTWGGIYFSGQSASGNLKHLNAYEGTDGIQANEGASIVIDSCSISDHVLTGISVLEGSNAVITGCKIWDNELGVFVTNADVSVQTSSIRYNRDGGIYLSVVPESGTDNSMVIERCVIGSNDGNGITISGKASPVVHQCSIFFNSPPSGDGYGIALQQYPAIDTVHAEQNYWGYTTPEEIAAQIYDRADDPGIGAYVGFIPWRDTEPLRMEIGR